MERDRGYTDQHMAEVSDNPEWTEEEFARARPFAEDVPRPGREPEPSDQDSADGRRRARGVA